MIAASHQGTTRQRPDAVAFTRDEQSFEVRSAFQLGAGADGDLTDAGVVHRIRGRVHARLARRSAAGDLVAARLSDVDVSAGDVVVRVRAASTRPISRIFSGGAMAANPSSRTNR